LAPTPSQAGMHEFIVWHRASHGMPSGVLLGLPEAGLTSTFAARSRTLLLMAILHH
jgi:hypothetical protein